MLRDRHHVTDNARTLEPCRHTLGCYLECEVFTFGVGIDLGLGADVGFRDIVFSPEPLGHAAVGLALTLCSEIKFRLLGSFSRRHV
ncbi:hypothetical protein AE618_06680 [Bosea vaviloviae]|uniref:Uncharacterized protein n=1 Tax=Bosea vaviloviae TaxID=1526658 RepID=A0A0N1F6J5_9HYPH|nr:hypothetical protein AE618_06680 [Bosea vaviloviae]